jgi:hypothetical protein
MPERATGRTTPTSTGWSSTVIRADSRRSPPATGSAIIESAAAGASVTWWCFVVPTNGMPRSAAPPRCVHSSAEATASSVIHSETSVKGPRLRISREMLCSSANHRA